LFLANGFLEERQAYVVAEQIGGEIAVGRHPHDRRFFLANLGGGFIIDDSLGVGGVFGRSIEIEPAHTPLQIERVLKFKRNSRGRANNEEVIGDPVFRIDCGQTYSLTCQPIDRGLVWKDTLLTFENFKICRISDLLFAKFQQRIERGLDRGVCVTSEEDCPAAVGDLFRVESGNNPIMFLRRAAFLNLF